jgi:hypothetical protein
LDADHPSTGVLFPCRITLTALAGAACATPVLVMPAGLDVQEAAEQAEIFAAAAILHLVPTRLDLARRLGAIVAAAFAGRMILSEAGTGQGATDGLTRVTPSLMASWLSRIPYASSAPISPLQSSVFPPSPPSTFAPSPPSTPPSLPKQAPHARPA